VQHCFSVLDQIFCSCFNNLEKKNFFFNIESGETEFGIKTKTELKKAPKPTPPKPKGRKPGQEEPSFAMKPKDKTVVEGMLTKTGKLASLFSTQQYESE